jgi:hypothetical protein
MMTASHQAGVRRRMSRAVALQALIALAILLVSACSSSSSTAASGVSGASAAAALNSACSQVSAVLTDGPDPGADPVGYAEAQILPLRQIQTSDATLAKAITSLADEYSSYYADNGTSKTVSAALNTSINRINSLCPGAGATP